MKPNVTVDNRGVASHMRWRVVIAKYDIVMVLGCFATVELANQYADGVRAVIDAE